MNTIGGSPFEGFNKLLMPGRVKLSPLLSSSFIFLNVCLYSPYPSSSASLPIGSNRLCLLLTPPSEDLRVGARVEVGEVTFGFCDVVLVGGCIESERSAISLGPSTSTFIIGVAGFIGDWP